MRDRLFWISLGIAFPFLFIFIVLALKVQANHINELSKSVKKIKTDVVRLKAEIRKVQ